MITRSPIGLPGAPIVVLSEGDIVGELLPNDLEVELDLPVVQGAGELVELGPGEYAGVLSVTIPPTARSRLVDLLISSSKIRNPTNPVSAKQPGSLVSVRCAAQ